LPALKDPETKALLEKQAMQTVGNSPEAFASFIRQDMAVWKAVAEQARVEAKQQASDRMLRHPIRRAVYSIP
jgi:hypothetical protein